MAKLRSDYFKNFQLPPGWRIARRKDAEPTTPQEASPEPEHTGYCACGIARGPDKPKRIELRCAKGLAVARPYSAISEIAYDRAKYSGFLLLFPGKLVTIRGRNLKPVIEALLASTCEFLQQIGEAEKAERGKPVITQLIITNSPARPAQTTERPPEPGRILH
jgi:hypothetical protein